MRAVLQPLLCLSVLPVLCFGQVVVSNSFVSGPGSGQNQVVNKLTRFIVNARNANNQMLSSGGYNMWEWTLDEGVQNTPLSATDNNDGTYSGQYMCTIQGWAFLNVKSAAGTHVMNSPVRFYCQTEAELSTSLSTISGLNGPIYAGIANNFAIIARDGMGRPFTGPIQWAINVVSQSGNTVPSTIRDNGDGMYTVVFSPPMPTYYSISIKDQATGRDLDNTPIRVVALTVPDSTTNTLTPTDPNSSEEPGDTVPPGTMPPATPTPAPPTHNPINLRDPAPGLFHVDRIDRAVAGEMAIFWVTMMDHAGDRFKEGGLANRFKVTPAGFVEDEGMGTYSIRFTPTLSGTNFVELTFDDQQVKGSPFLVDVSPAPLSGAHNTASGEGLAQAKPGLAASFRVFARDRYGNLLSNGGAIVTAVLTSPTNIEHEIIMDDLGNGQYLGTYTAETAGVYSLMIRTQGEPIQGSPFTVRVGSATTQFEALRSGNGKGVFIAVAVVLCIICLCRSLRTRNEASYEEVESNDTYNSTRVNIHALQERENLESTRK